jgi:hypothetical protein
VGSRLHSMTPVGRLMQKGPHKRILTAEACTTTGPPTIERFRFLLGPPSYRYPCLSLMMRLQLFLKHWHCVPWWQGWLHTGCKDLTALHSLGLVFYFYFYIFSSAACLSQVYINLSRHICQIAKKWLLAFLSVCLSIHLHGITQLPLDRLYWNLIFDYFSKIVHKIHLWLKSDKDDG